MEEIGVLGDEYSLKCCSGKDPKGRAGRPTFFCEILKNWEPLEKPKRNIIVNSFAKSQARKSALLGRPGTRVDCYDIIHDRPAECDIVETTIEGVEGTINELSCIFV